MFVINRVVVNDVKNLTSLNIKNGNGIEKARRISLVSYLTLVDVSTSTGAMKYREYEENLRADSVIKIL